MGRMLGKIYKPLYRVTYPINSVTYGLVFNGLDRGNQSASDFFTIVSTSLATLSLATLFTMI